MQATLGPVFTNHGPIGPSTAFYWEFDDNFPTGEAPLAPSDNGSDAPLDQCLFVHYLKLKSRTSPIQKTCQVCSPVFRGKKRHLTVLF